MKGNSSSIAMSTSNLDTFKGQIIKKIDLYIIWIFYSKSSCTALFNSRWKIQHQKVWPSLNCTWWSYFHFIVYVSSAIPQIVIGNNSKSVSGNASLAQWDSTLLRTPYTKYHLNTGCRDTFQDVVSIYLRISLFSKGISCILTNETQTLSSTSD